MELTQLKYFRAVCRRSHFTKAAEDLRVSQPGLSRAIQALEAELGVALFDRDKRNVHLNSYGQAFYAHIERILEELDAATAEIEDLRGGTGGSLAIATSMLMDDPSGISDFVRDYVFGHPSIDTHIFYQFPQNLLALLQDRRVDFVIGTRELNEPEVEQRTLYVRKLGLVVNAAHPLAGRRSVRLAELSGERFVCNNSSLDLNDTIYEICRKAGFWPNMVFECDNGELIGEAISRGLGVAFSTGQRFDKNNEADDRPVWSRELVFVPVEDEFCIRTTYVAYLKGRYQTRAARTFLEELLARCAEM